MADKKEDWRKKEPSEKQLSFILSLGSSEKPKTSGEASSLINRLLLVGKIKKIKEDIVKKEILSQAQVDKIVKETDDWMAKAIITYCGIADNCLNVGFDEPPQIGMFFNNYLSKQKT